MTSRLLFLGALFLLAVALALAAAAAFSWVNSPATEAARAAEVAYQVQRAKLDLETWRAVQPFVIVALGLTILAVPVGLVAAALGVAWMVKRRVELVRPDRRGLLPMDRARLQAGAYDQHAAAALTGYHAAQIETARNPAPAPLPAPVAGARVVYSPRYGSAPGPGRAEGAQPSQALPAPAGVTVARPPTLGELLWRGEVGPGKPLLLGFTPGEGGTLQPVTGALDDVYSVGIGGMPGGGKTNTAAALAAQSVALGSRLIVMDPHRDAGRDSLARTLAPLAPAMVTAPAAEEREILAVLEMIHGELERRKAGGSGDPWAIVIDEWTALVRRARLAALLIPLVEELGQESRKLGLRLLLCAQVWTVDAVGGSALRDALASSYVHRSKPQQARALIPTAGRDVATLGKGQALLWRTSGEVVPVTVPRVLPQDLTYVAAMLPAPVGGGADDGAAWGGPGSSSSSSRSSSPPTPQNGQKTAIYPATTATTTTTTDRPALRVVKPLTRLERAEAAGMPLSDTDRARLAGLDAGKSPGQLAEVEVGYSGGGKWTRIKREIENLAAMIENWPDGEMWGDAPAAGQDLTGDDRGRHVE